ncbi:DUF3862 domain-containing protein [Paenibacillus larvae]|nr:DUF3862 domain-containing protein [Paenibacillus larvae]MDT2262338.1 DUF3862 domain-containing protein [Paenibacillus larvae]MDT2277745.1 DUF3862 domain-containing protein [Paenibacillus larvae]
MKKFLGIITIIALVGVLAACGDKETAADANKPAASEAPKASETPKASEAPKASETPKASEAPKTEGTITKEMFDKIQNGMKYEEVKDMIGSEGELSMESGEKGSEFHMATYIWKGSDIGSNGTFTFQGGKLTSKAQIGLK